MWSFGYGRDALGRVGTSTDRIPAARHSFTYDALNRLTGDQRPNGSSVQWGYDAAFNLSSVATTTNSGTTTTAYCYDANATQLQTLKGGSCSGSTIQSFGYNANGDRTSSVSGGTTTTYGYDSIDELTSITRGSTTVGTYAYDGDGLRASKTVSGTTSQFTWDSSQGLNPLVSDGTNGYVTEPGAPISAPPG